MLIEHYLISIPPGTHRPWISPASAMIICRLSGPALHSLPAMSPAGYRAHLKGSHTLFTFPGVFFVLGFKCHRSTTRCCCDTVLPFHLQATAVSKVSHPTFGIQWDAGKSFYTKMLKWRWGWLISVTENVVPKSLCCPQRASDFPL